MAQVSCPGAPGDAHVDSVRAHVAGRPVRRRGALPPPAGAGRIHPPRRARRVQLAAPRLDRVPQRRAHRPRGDGRGRLPGGPFPGAAPPRALRGERRWTEYGDNLFRLKDRSGNDFLLAPTHEEMFTLLVKGLYSSYKDLPLCIYQIQTKYRDEARPRAGLLRGRDFVMKDSYSFDVDDQGLQRSYERHREAYIKTLRSTGTAVRDRVGDVGCDGRLGVGGVPRSDRRRRRHVRALHQVRLRRQHRGRAGAGPRSDPVRRLARRPRRGHARHAHDPDPRRPPQRPSRVPAPPTVCGRRPTR